jgi:hypothetical protein
MPVLAIRPKLDYVHRRKESALMIGIVVKQRGRREALQEYA